MGAVASLADAKAKRQPHASGTVICGGCKHQWQAVAPLRLDDDLECPSCHSMRGIWLRNFGPANNELRFSCNHCEAQFFYVLTQSVMCIGCGTETSFAQLAEA